MVNELRAAVAQLQDANRLLQSRVRAALDAAGVPDDMLAQERERLVDDARRRADADAT